MKKVIITLLLSLMITNMFSFTFQTEYNYQMPTFGATSSYIPYNNSQSIEYRGIGYTTNYSNGQFNSTQYYQGTYTPSLSGFNGRPGQPRRVKGYTADGDSINTDNDGAKGNPSDMWKNGYDYYYDKEAKTWYRGHWTTDWRGRKIYSYETWLDDWSIIFGWHWSILDYGKSDNAVQYYEQNPVPIGDNYIWFMVCIVSIYSLIKWIKLKRLTN